MNPIDFKGRNLNYLGPTDDIGDLLCRRDFAPDGTSVIYSVWEPTLEERELIADGCNIRLGIHGMEPIPPVSVNVHHPDDFPETPKEVN